MTKGYGMLALFGVAWISQLVATFGIATSIATMVFEWGIMGLGSVLGLVYSIFMFMAYNACKTSWSTTQATASEMAQLEWEWGGYLAVMSMVWVAYA